MNDINFLFSALGITNSDARAVNQIAKQSGVKVSKLKYHNISNTLPNDEDIKKISKASKKTPVQLMLEMGNLDRNMISAIQKNAEKIHEIIKDDIDERNNDGEKPEIAFETNWGTLYHGDCLSLTPFLESESVDLVFADPPFNLNKLYPSRIDDNLKEIQYLKWCEHWLGECIRILKPGGSLFVWNLPKWNTSLAGFLNGRLTFRHWISVDVKYTLPIPKRLYPSHYSLLYYCKGEKPSKFHPDRLPMEICPHCMGDLRDYGGYKNKMNPKGVNMTDVWFDIPPVRHAKYKKRKNANELSLRLMDRIIEMASDEGDMIFDPFGGSGTTYVVSELKKRKWIGIELGPLDDIIHRLENISVEAELLAKIREGYNNLFTKANLQKRIQKGLWTPDSVRNSKRPGKEKKKEQYKQMHVFRD